jgi:choline dehydrogenase-like flavoprotein
MIEDARQHADGSNLDADICIVGAGAAGITLALELAGSGLNVLLVESGGTKDDSSTQSLYEGEVAEARLHSLPDRYRVRRFGGSTTIWGGRCIPFDPIDFEKRDYVPHSGWPISYDDVLPHYEKANRICEAGEFQYDADKVAECALPMIEGFSSPRVLTNSLERFSCPTDFGQRYQHQLAGARNLRVLLWANCTNLDCSPDGQRITGLTLKTLQGKKLKVNTKQVVLATGGLEVPRLLLASRDVHQDGIGNQHDVVGRYYQCHLSGTIGTLDFDRPVNAIHHGYDMSWDGIYCRRRFTLTPEVQRSLGIGNFVGRLHFPRIGDPSHRVGILSLCYLARGLISYEYAKRLEDPEFATIGNWFRHARNVVSDPIYTAQFLLHWLFKRKLATRKFPSVVIRHRIPRFSLEFHTEQYPYAQSRVSLGEPRDPLGMPRIKVDWRYTQDDVHGVARGLRVMKEEIERSGAGRFHYDETAVETELVRYGAYGGHHIGTTRMGNDPRDSVVDSDCRVHGIDNLYIASSSVFPTSSQANPTLTILALTLRLAAELRNQSSRSNLASSIVSATAPISSAAA